MWSVTRINPNLKIFFRQLGPLAQANAIIFLLSAVTQQATAQSGIEAECSRLGMLNLPETKVSSSAIVPDNGFTPPGRDQALASPAFCRLAATSDPAVNFEVWMPVQDWNGKFQVVGNGGMAGTISYAAMANALNRGYAVASTDTGHKAGPISFDASWASGRMDLIEDFGHRSLHITTEHGKAVVRAFYSAAPSYSYYVGCSKGGQQGLMEAQRYPDDFDGIIAGNPAHNWTRFYAGAHLWYSLAMLEDEESWIPPAKLDALGSAVNNACDAQDGIRDGILMNPLACDFEPASIACPVGVDNNSCLSDKQVNAVEKIWSGVLTSDGELVFPGLVPGGEASRGGWSTWVTGQQTYGSLHWRGGEGFFRWFVFDDKDWDFTSFDFDSDLDYALQRVGDAVDANNPDLSEFEASGGKLLVYHGWSDPDISPVSSINYYESVIELEQRRGAVSEIAALDNTRDYFRMFMVPGMGHCSGGPGPDRFDALSALENWVENGVAPDSITARKLESGVEVMSRPLCPYPEVAQYSGDGSTNDSENFSCVVPQ